MENCWQNTAEKRFFLYSHLLYYSHSHTVHDCISIRMTSQIFETMLACWHLATNWTAAFLFRMMSWFIKAVYIKQIQWKLSCRNALVSSLYLQIKFANSAVITSPKIYIDESLSFLNTDTWLNSLFQFSFIITLRRAYFNHFWVLGVSLYLYYLFICLSNRSYPLL